MLPKQPSCPGSSLAFHTVALISAQARCGRKLCAWLSVRWVAACPGPTGRPAPFIPAENSFSVLLWTVPLGSSLRGLGPRPARTLQPGASQTEVLARAGGPILWPISVEVVS